MKDAWFGPRKFGWGASPRNWKGWLAGFIFAVALFATMRFVVPHLVTYFGLSRRLISGAALVIEASIFMLLIRAKFDPDA